MYCGSCIHDNTLAAALMELGHEVALVPLYTPIRTDEPPVAMDGIFYGAVNVYLQQAVRLFSRTPRWLDRLFDSEVMLGMASRLAGSTDAASLGPLTLSVLRGEEGRQQKELGRLTAWLGAFRPDIVQLGNGLLIGLAAEIGRATGAPVLSGLTGEDLFLAGLPEPHRGEVVTELRRRAAGLDGFVAPSRHYAERMRELLELPTERFHVVPLGVDLRHLGAAAADGEPDRDEGGPVTIGYLARACPEKGLHLLIEAFELLAEKAGADRVRLEVGGWISKRDRRYVAELAERAGRLASETVFHGELDPEAKRRLLAGIDILSVPATYEEPKGLYVLEALAHGVPVVQPDHGAFPELIAATGGGLLVPPGSPEALAAALGELVEDPRRRRELGRRGRRAVERDLHSRRMAERTAAVYERVLAGGGAETGAP